MKLLVLTPLLSLTIQSELQLGINELILSSKTNINIIVKQNGKHISNSNNYIEI
ncbi:hypothetical protein HNQ88_002193 [Aureibacter tunicatorum]|uniref:Uncharacterized protein n=1 Tax=Aureibacter tunicatorum TaxID=866807 RepID=A0AAE4BRX4_9BACT|nr:hypothetical protein [Aureibacter tunicatorum]BDD04918.1 hypothetical protein AUTU_24010 [Aureibacter tunicatorum]